MSNKLAIALPKPGNHIISFSSYVLTSCSVVHRTYISLNTAEVSVYTFVYYLRSMIINKKWYMHTQSIFKAIFSTLSNK